MYAAALRRLSDICELVKLDTTPNALQLTPRGEYIRASYVSSYVSGWIEASGDLDRPVAISAETFRKVTGLFDPDSKVVLEPGASSLTVKGGRRRASVPYDTRVLEAIDSPGDMKGEARVDTQLLSKELALAGKFTDTNLNRPVLTCVLVQGSRSRQKLAFSAMNPISAVMYDGLMPAATVANDFSFIVDPAAVSVGLKVLISETIAIRPVRVNEQVRAVEFVSVAGVVRVPCTQGTWPDLRAARNSYTTGDVTPLTFPASLVASISKACSALELPGLTFSPKGLIYGTGYAEDVELPIDEPLFIASGALQGVGQILSGGNVTFELAGNGVRCKQDEHTVYFMVRRGFYNGEPG